METIAAYWLKRGLLPHCFTLYFFFSMFMCAHASNFSFFWVVLLSINYYYTIWYCLCLSQISKATFLKKILYTYKNHSTIMLLVFDIARPKKARFAFQFFGDIPSQVHAEIVGSSRIILLNNEKCCFRNLFFVFHSSLSIGKPIYPRYCR